MGDYAGKTVVLYFYPKDDTPGCTTEACAFRDSMADFAERGVVVLGVSADTAESHERFAEKHDLSFPLLADPEGEIIADYGVEGGRGNAKRVTFLIDVTGTIANVYRNVDPAGHTEEILADLDQAVA